MRAQGIDPNSDLLHRMMEICVYNKVCKAHLNLYLRLKQDMGALDYFYLGKALGTPRFPSLRTYELISDLFLQTRPQLTLQERTASANLVLQRPFTMEKKEDIVELEKLIEKVHQRVSVKGEYAQKRSREKKLTMLEELH
jgi:hypothetical protein